jgi:hypothetical protein
MIHGLCPNLGIPPFSSHDPRQVTSYCFNDLQPIPSDVSGLRFAPKHLGASVLFDLVHGDTTSPPASPVRFRPRCRRPGSRPSFPDQRERKRLPSDQPMRDAFGLVSLAALLLPGPCSGANGNVLNDYRTKTTLLAALTKFIQCPPDASHPEQTSLLLCVFGDFSFGTSCAEMAGEASARISRTHAAKVSPYGGKDGSAFK